MNDAVEMSVASYLGASSIDWQKLKPIMCFVVLWNRLEAKDGRTFNPQLLDENANRAVESPGFDLARYEPQIRFFRERYIDREELLDTLFRGGSPKEAPLKELRRKLIRSDEMTSKDCLKAVLFVPYRIRNNLFHGNKETIELYRQASLFENVNQVLCQFHSDLG